MRIITAVLVHNTPDLAQHLITELEGKVVVVDNGSNMTPFHKFWLSFPENKYFSGGWNQAMEELCPLCDFVWMLNSDIIGTDKGMSDRLGDTIKNIADPMLGAITPAFNSPHPIFHKMPVAQNIDARRVRWIDWCCPVVSTKAWQDVGPFDEDFKGYGADLDWCKRARDKGYHMYVDDSNSIHHLGSITAFQTGNIGVMNNVATMNELLHKKYGVSNWSQMC